MALIPIFLTGLGFNCSIDLPKDDGILRFIDRMRLLEFLHTNFLVRGRKKPHIPRYQFHDRMTDIHRDFLKPITQTNIFNSKWQIMELLKEEGSKHLLRSLYSEAASDFSIILMELISNIYDHSEETTGCVTVQINRPAGKHREKTKSEIDGAQMLIAVSDLGIGIAASMAKHAVPEIALSLSKLKEWVVLEQATLPYVSRTGLRTRGLGLYCVSRAATTTQIRSGKGAVHIDGNKSTSQSHRDAFVQGTSVIAIIDISEKLREQEKPAIRIYKNIDSKWANKSFQRIEQKAASAEAWRSL